MKKILFILGLLLLPLTAFSATQGTLGSSSTGTININISIGSVVQVTQLKDITLSYTPGVDVGDLTRVVDLCIYANNTAGSYKVTVSDANAATGNMRISTGGATPSYIPYTTQWFTNATGTGSPAATLTSGTQTATFSGASTSSRTCGNGTNNNAAIKLTFLEADLTAAKAGSYTDVVTILVSPI